MPERELQWGIEIRELAIPNEWSLGINLSHCIEETYFFINAFKYQIIIGKILKEVDKNE